MQGRWDGLVTKGQYRELATLWDFALIGGMMEHGDAYEVSIPVALIDLAEKSGHPEIEHIPFVTMGFSNGGWWAVNVARVMPERTIAVAICAMPGLSGAGHNPEYRAAMQTVPVMQVNGASDGATHDWVRKEDPTFPKLRQYDLPWTLALQWNTKHKYGETNSLAFPFLREAIHMRLPADADARKGPVKLNPIDRDAVWVGDSRTWSKGNAEIAPATEEALADPKMVWLLNESVARDWCSFQSLNRVKARVVLAGKGPERTLTVENPPPDTVSISYYNGDRLLAGPSDDSGPVPVTLSPGVYSIHAVLTDSAGKRMVTPPVLELYTPEP
jgi:hypothetical protein